jgi:hypothetical protein
MSASKQWILGGVLQKYKIYNNDKFKWKAHARSSYVRFPDAHDVVFSSNGFVVVSQVKIVRFRRDLRGILEWKYSIV